MEYSRNAKKQIIEEVRMVLHFNGEKIPKSQQSPKTEAVLSWIDGSYQVVRTCEYHTHGLHIYAYHVMPNKHNALNSELANRIRICDKSGTIVFDSGCGANSACIAVKGKWRRKLRSVYVDALYEDPVLSTP